MNPSRSSPLLARCVSWIGATLAGVLCGGCLTGDSTRPSEEARLTKERAQASAFQSSVVGGPHKVSIQELDQLTYGYADRYYMVISSATDAIKRDNPDPVQRRRAHQMKLNGVAAMNDIVSGNDPYSRTLDLVVSVTLQSRLLIDEDHGERVFGPRAPGLINAIRMMRVEAWNLAAKVLTQEQLDSLDYLILEWRRTHPEIDQVSFVKFDNFAGVRAAGLLSDFKAGRGLLAPVTEATQVIKDWSRLTERVFWYTKRAPNIAGIQMEAAVNESLAAPEISALVKDADRVGQMAAALPQTIEAQRKAIFAELDARQALLTNSLADVRHILAEADNVGRTASGLTTNLQQTLLALGDTLKVGEDVGRRFGWDKQSQAHDAPRRPFDIQDYSTALSRLNEVLTNLQQVSLSADQLAYSEGWRRALQDVTEVTDRRVDRVFHSLCLLLGLAFVLAVVYRFISLKLAQGLAPPSRPSP